MTNQEKNRELIKRAFGPYHYTPLAGPGTHLDYPCVAWDLVAEKAIVVPVKVEHGGQDNIYLPHYTAIYPQGDQVVSGFAGNRICLLGHQGNQGFALAIVLPLPKERE